MSDDYIAKAFAGLDDRYPGSKRKRRDAQPVKEVKGSPSENSWDAHPLVKIRNGVETEFFLPSALGLALGGKSSVTIRFWEQKGRIPSAPYRLPAYTTPDGKRVPGKRVYTRPLIEIAIEEFAARGLLDEPRIQWSKHPDLTIALFERWRAQVLSDK